MLTLAFVGRPNVGKSTLFNRFVKSGKAIIHDLPGVTRDYKQAEAKIGNYQCNIIDTPGYESDDNTQGLSKGLSHLMREKMHLGMAQADIIIFVLDALSGVCPDDTELARILHQQSQKILLLVNKADRDSTQATLLDAYRLGFEDILPISAAHGNHVGDLIDYIDNYMIEHDNPVDNDDRYSQLMRCCVVGRPNVGKSSLINAMTGEDRVLTSNMAGTTRDSIAVYLRDDIGKIILNDTAGIRRKSRVEKSLEKMTVQESLYIVRFSDVCLCVLDADQFYHAKTIEKQDAQIIRYVVEEGRTIVILLNKWDKIPYKHRDILYTTIYEQISYQFPRITGVPILTVSAHNNMGLEMIIPTMRQYWQLWCHHISTSALNKWLEEALINHTPPLIRGRRLKIRYVTQAKSRPPRFILFTNNSKDFPQDYLRYLENHLRLYFDLSGIPLRLAIRQGNNPYHQ